ncbi:hypothetical protein ACWER9_13780 [Micromonospora sp. NPDC003944]
MCIDRYRAAFERVDPAAMAAALNDVSRVPAEIVNAMAAGRRVPDPVEARRSAVGWLHQLEAVPQDSTDITRWSAIAVPTLVADALRQFFSEVAAAA